MKRCIFNYVFVILLACIHVNLVYAGADYHAKVTVTGSGHGTVYIDNIKMSESTKDSYSANDPLEFVLRFDPARGYQFTRWSLSSNANQYFSSDANATTSTENTVTVVVKTHGTKNQTRTCAVTYETEAKDSYIVKYVSVDSEGNSNTGKGSYTVTGAYSATIDHSLGYATYDNDNITLNATPVGDYKFSRFYGKKGDGEIVTIGDAGTKSQTVNIPEDVIEVGAEFALAFNVAFASSVGGTYTVTGPNGQISVPSAPFEAEASQSFTLSATPNSGFAFARYTLTDEIGNVSTLGEPVKANQTLHIMSGPVTVTAEFTDKPFLVGDRIYGTLDAALQAVATSSSKTILVINDYTVPEGVYTIPAGVVLLIPKDASQTSEALKIDRTLETTPTPSVYRKLTLDAGVQINVSGVIEVGGTQSAGSQGAAGAGIPVGKYGQLVMHPGSKITLSSGAKLRAWGFVTGVLEGTGANAKYVAGEIDARRGSTVYEQFQMYDWKGGSHTSGMITKTNPAVFPINQYFIQNVEVPTTFHPGSSLYSVTSISVTNIEYSPTSPHITKTTMYIASDNVQIIGVEGSTAMFLMDEADNSENTYVKKWYDAVNDKQMYEVNSSAKLGSMEIALSGVPVLGDLNFNSSNYTLPITNNMKIYLKSGQMQITENTVMLPGSEIEIAKTSTVSIKAGKSLYLYDQAEWGDYVFNNSSTLAYTTQVKYTPTHNGKPNKRTPFDVKPASAAINVHGTFDIQSEKSGNKTLNGALYTTAGGANIFSSVEDAGTVQFTAASSNSSSVYQPESYTVNTTRIPIVSDIVEAVSPGTKAELPAASDVTYAEAPCTSAQLKNDGGSYTSTVGTSANTSYCFLDLDNDGLGEWMDLTTEGCFVHDQYGVYYAKPSAYVALANGSVENLDHTYTSADGDHLFILLGDCQWWEVVYDQESGLYYCAKNDTYYYYSENDCWEPKTFKVHWKNWNGESILYQNIYDEWVDYYELPYKAMPEYLGDNPKRAAQEGYYTYDFAGWSPELAPVTGEVTYTAQYSKTPVLYTIRWRNTNMTEREVTYFQRDEMPYCPSEPADMSNLEWVPSIAPVTGDAVYTLHQKENKTKFTIIWKNWNGDVLQTDENFTGNPAYDMGENDVNKPTRPALDDIEFEFSGWSPTIVSPANHDAVYVAQFIEKPKTYTITWNWADGEDAEHSTTRVSNGVAYNSFPQYTDAETPHKDLGDNYNYMFSGWSPAIVAATSDKEYTAQYIAVPKNRMIDAEEAMAASTIQEVTTLTITTTGQLTIPGTSRIDATNLILEATKNSSGELFATNTSINATNVYYDLTLDTDRRHWRAFGVPWPVGDLKVTKLVEVKNRAGAECHRELALGRDYDIMYYNGAYRAANGPGAACWEYVQDHGNTLTPGQGYMIAFTSEVGTIRFTKAAEANVVYNSTSLPIVENTGDPTNPDANWNAIANPMPYHSLMNVGVSLVQVHDGGEIGHDGYNNAPADGKYVVGKMVYFQAPTAKSTVAISKAGSEAVITPYAAPARREAEREVTLNDFYHVELLNIEGVKNADVFIRAEEDKPDTYYIGKDVACMGLTSARAQMWVNRYNVKLCMNTTAPINDVAEYAISVYAPSNGEYTIRLNHQPEEDYTLYLTRDGEAIWDLSMGDYVTDLTSGVHKEFGLRLSANKAPEVATGMDEAVVDAKGETRKVIIDNNVYIIRGGEVYTMTGAKIQ